MRCFVTVGTTQFDELIQAVVSEKSLSLLRKLGFNELSIQSGNFDVVSLFNALKYIQDVSERNGVVYAKSDGLNVSVFNSFCYFFIVSD
jgi:UDP-N-acetylglucosamine transferase subunit ALG13